MYVIMCNHTLLVESPQYSLNKVDTNLTWLGYSERSNGGVLWTGSPSAALCTKLNVKLHPILAEYPGSILDWSPGKITLHSIYDDDLNDISDQYPEYFI